MFWWWITSSKASHILETRECSSLKSEVYYYVSTGQIIYISIYPYVFMKETTRINVNAMTDVVDFVEARRGGHGAQAID